MKTKIVLLDLGSQSGGCKEYYVLGCDAVQSSRSELTFQGNILPPSSMSKSKRNKKTSRTT
jgi:hypothetical protein